MDNFRVTYKRGNLVWTEIMAIANIVEMFNKSVYTIVKVEDLAIADTINDLVDSFEHNNNDYYLAVFDNEQGMALKDFPLDLTSLAYLLEKIADNELTVLSWIMR